MLIVYSLFVMIMTVITLLAFSFHWSINALTSNYSRAGWLVVYLIIALVWYWVIKHLPSVMGV